MSDYAEYRNGDTRLDPAYPPQNDSYVSDNLHRHRPSKHSRRTQASYASNGTWIPYPDYPPAPYHGHSPRESFATLDPNSQQQYSPPPDAIRAPSPAMTSRTHGRRSEAGEPEFEYQSVDAEPEVLEDTGEVHNVGDLEGQPLEVQGKGGRSRFVGGFVAGLKKLPRAVLWNRRPTINEDPGFISPLPQYVPPPNMGYGPSVNEPRAPTPALSKHSSHRSQRQQTLPGDDLTPPMNGNGIHGPGDTDSTAVHQDPGPSRIMTNVNGSAPLMGLASPNFRPTSDYDKMPTPPRTPTAPSITSYLTRVHRFLKDLSGLPWVAPPTGRVAVDYFPGENPRSRYLYPHYREREANKTWYTSKHKDVDLLSGDIPLQSRRTTRNTRTTFDSTIDTHHYPVRDSLGPLPQRSRTQRSTATSQNAHRRTRRPPRSYANSHPNSRSHASGSYSRSSAASPGPVPPLPGISSPTHSHLAFMDPHHHAQISYPYGYTYSPAPAQPLFMYGPVSPASAQDGQQQQGQGQGVGQAPPMQAMQPAMPVYLVAGLPPQVVAGLPPGFVPISPSQQVRSGTPTPRGGSPKSG